VFTARYGLDLYTKQTRLVFKGLIIDLVWPHVSTFVRSHQAGTKLLE